MYIQHDEVENRPTSRAVRTLNNQICGVARLDCAKLIRGPVDCWSSGGGIDLV